MFSIYRNTYEIQSGGELELRTLWQLIRLHDECRLSTTVDFGKGTDMWPYHVRDYRRFGTQRIKLTLIPAVIFYATTLEHDRKIIRRPTGYFCIDLDYNDNQLLFDRLGMKAIKAMVNTAFKSVALMFISPSGKGLKVVHKILPKGNDTEDHFHISNKVFEHYQVLYNNNGLVIDQKCKDWNRLCYLSYDREAYYNEVAEAETVAIPEITVLPVPVIMNDENGYQLSRDKWDKDQLCPRCNGGSHRDKSFTYYVDKNGSRLDGCGVCSRSKCSANIKPWEVYPNVKWKYLGKVRS